MSKEPQGGFWRRADAKVPTDADTDGWCLGAAVPLGGVGAPSQVDAGGVALRQGADAARWPREVALAIACGTQPVHSHVLGSILTIRLEEEGNAPEREYRIPHMSHSMVNVGVFIARVSAFQHSTSMISVVPSLTCRRERQDARRLIMDMGLLARSRRNRSRSSIRWASPASSLLEGGPCANGFALEAHS